MSPARHLKSKKRILTDALQNCEKSAETDLIKTLLTSFNEFIYNIFSKILNRSYKNLKITLKLFYIKTAPLSL